MQSNLDGYLQALESGRSPEMEIDLIDREIAGAERLILALRLDEGVDVNGALSGVRVPADTFSELTRAGLLRSSGGLSVLTSNPWLATTMNRTNIPIKMIVGIRDCLTPRNTLSFCSKIARMSTLERIK